MRGIVAQFFCASSQHGHGAFLVNSVRGAASNFVRHQSLLEKSLLYFPVHGKSLKK